MNADVELDEWRHAWCANAVAPTDLRARVHRETRRRRILLILKIGITIIWGCASAAWAVVSSARNVSMLALGVWAFIAMSWTFSALNERGTREPAMSTTVGFLDVSIVRCRSDVRRIAFAGFAYVVWLVYWLIWLRHDLATRQHVTFWNLINSPSFAAVSVATVCLGAVAIWRRRLLKRELRNLLNLRREMDDQQ